MDEIQAETVKNSEAISSTKMEVTVARKELQALSLELQSLVSVVSILHLDHISTDTAHLPTPYHGGHVQFYRIHDATNYLGLILLCMVCHV